MASLDQIYTYWGYVFIYNDRACHNIIPVIHNKQAIVSIFPKYDQPWKIQQFHYRTDIPIY